MTTTTNYLSFTVIIDAKDPKVTQSQAQSALASLLRTAMTANAVQVWTGLASVQSDVALFHRKFGVPVADVPSLLDDNAREFRVKFMQEELDEYKEACEAGDLLKAADALVDLVYVAQGTADMHCLPWTLLWREVQRANMAKERAKGSDDPRSVRKSSLDVVKPEGWTPPDHSQFIGSGPWPTFSTMPVPEVTHSFCGGQVDPRCEFKPPEVDKSSW